LMSQKSTTTRDFVNVPYYEIFDIIQMAFLPEKLLDFGARYITTYTGKLNRHQPKSLLACVLLFGVKAAR
jgi:hypothetical protein